MLSFTNLTTGPDPLVRSPAIPFSFPKFDPSLGSLQSIGISWDLSGTVAGSATGVGNWYSFETTLTHWVFFDFEAPLDGIVIAEPALRVTASIPARTQNLAVLFDPSFQSTSRTFTVTEGDYRFDSWVKGPGSVDGALQVFFSNTARGPNEELLSFPGSDSGVYSGTLSFVYNYVPVPEPRPFALAVVGLLLVASRFLHREAA